MKQFATLFLLCAVSVHFSPGTSRKNQTIATIVSAISPPGIRSTIDTLAGFGTRHTLSDSASGHGNGAARRWIKSVFERYARESNGRMTVEFQEFIAPASARIPRPARIVNVVATLRPSLSPGAGSPDKPGNGAVRRGAESQMALKATGAHPDRVFLVSGHYDSRSSNALDSVSAAPGADDDGSGTALVLELARVLCKYEFRSTIVFAIFSGEEQGLFGSTHFADLAKRRGWNIEGVLNDDIVGSIQDGNGEVESTKVRLFSEAYNPLDTGSIFRQRNFLGLENDGASRTLARYAKEIGEQYVPDCRVMMVYRRDRFLRGGDQLPFHERGFPAVRFTEARENFDRQHQDLRTENGKSFGDLPEFINEAYCARIAGVNASTIAMLAFAPSAPESVQVLTKNLDYDTDLRWRKNAEADIAGYDVRYRETTSPVWQYSVFTRDTIITIKASKDDYLFGVQAVDQSGNVSLPSLPRPAR